VAVGEVATSLPCRNYDNEGRHTWRSRFFPHMGTHENLKRQERDLQIRLTCGIDRNWKASWVGLADADPCSISGPLPGPPQN
jgi:hypothetical protein